MAEKIITTRIVLTHDEYASLASKTLKAGEAVLAKVGTTQAPGEVAQPIWMMKIGDGTSTVENCPWLVAPAADVYDWAKKENLSADDVPTLEISKINGLQDAIDAINEELENHTHVAADVTDFDNSVKTVVNGMGIATSDTVTALGTRVTTAEGKITTLETAVNTTLPAAIAEKVAQDAYDTKVAALEKADTDEAAAREALAGRVATLEGIDHTVYAKTEDVNSALADKVDADTYATDKEALEAADADLDTAVKAAQADATAAKNAIEAFLDENAATDDVVNTLKEIQAGLDAGEASAASLLAEVNKIKDGTTVVPKATDADTVDGKHAADFAEAGHNHDTVYSKLGHTHTVAEITDYATDVAAKIKVETDARVGAVEDLQGQIDGVKATADTALQSITTTANGGLKVTGTNQIDIDDSIVFVLDGGTAANL